jgi:phytoene synthase
MRSAAPLGVVDLIVGEAAALDRLRRRLDGIYAGSPADIAADRAFSRVVRRYGMPRQLPEALLDGFAWDAEGRSYETISDLRAYGARVAGTVGAMMTVLMRSRDGSVIARATDLGVAMQLTNIARDVGEDARAGRLYLPRAWMRDAGIDPDGWLAAPRFDPQLAGVVRRLLDEADRLYQRSTAGIGQLPIVCRPSIRAAQVLYAEIGREVERQGFDSVSRRAVVDGKRKLALLGWSILTSQRIATGLVAEPLEETRFLVDAVVATPTPRPELGPGASIDDQLGWLMDLFMRLDTQGRDRKLVGRDGPADPVRMGAD